MAALLKLFLDIALLRRGPQDVPASPVLCGLALLAYAALGFLLFAVGASPLIAVGQTVLDLVLLTGVVRTLLAAHGHRARFRQTFTALTGTGALFALAGLPLTLWLLETGPTPDAPALPSTLYLMLVLWSVVVMGHVLRHALGVSRGVGLAYAFGYLVVSVVVMTALFPQLG